MFLMETPSSGKHAPGRQKKKDGGRRFRDAESGGNPVQVQGVVFIPAQFPAAQLQ